MPARPRHEPPARIARFDDVQTLLRVLRPTQPVLCIRPRVIQEGAAHFRCAFPGRTLYPVECNPHPSVLRALRGGGVRDFEVASLPEIEQVRAEDPEAGVHFMHPVKERRAIREAYHRHGVRRFGVDHPDELGKLFFETGARDLAVFVRIALPKTAVPYSASAKFGAEPQDAAWLMQAAAWCGARVGISFHVGSQCLDPDTFRAAFECVASVVARSGVEPEWIDVGGGFPFGYPDVEAPPLEEFVSVIRDAAQRLGLRRAPRLWAEPGRWLVAAGCSAIVQVRLRKDDQLYVNDGVHGSFSEQLAARHALPARLLPRRGKPSGAPREFAVHGPTGDPRDVLPVPLTLPDDVAEGDWIEVDQIGAYAKGFSRFEGFGAGTFAEVFDEPLARLTRNSS